MILPVLFAEEIPWKISGDMTKATTIAMAKTMNPRTCPSVVLNVVFLVFHIGGLASRRRLFPVQARLESLEIRLPLLAELGTFS